jgi:seryl-tRNA(Sec) selenium transferase
VIAVECADVVEAERKLRTREDSIVARIENERLILDLRTVFFWEEDSVAAALHELTRV